MQKTALNYLQNKQRYECLKKCRQFHTVQNDGFGTSIYFLKNTYHYNFEKRKMVAACLH